MSDLQPLGRVLIILGVAIIVLGLALTFWGKIPFLGRLPGDIAVQKGSFRFFFPVVTMLAISLFLTVIINVVIWLFRR